MKDKPRIGTNNESRRIEICNGNYAPSGTRIGDFERPWNVFTPRGFRTFATHTEAIEYADQEVGQHAV